MGKRGPKCDPPRVLWAKHRFVAVLGLAREFKKGLLRTTEKVSNSFASREADYAVRHGTDVNSNTNPSVIRHHRKKYFEETHDEKWEPRRDIESQLGAVALTLGIAKTGEVLDKTYFEKTKSANRAVTEIKAPGRNGYKPTPEDALYTLTTMDMTPDEVWPTTTENEPILTELLVKLHRCLGKGRTVFFSSEELLVFQMIVSGASFASTDWGRGVERLFCLLLAKVRSDVDENPFSIENIREGEYGKEFSYDKGTAAIVTAQGKERRISWKEIDSIFRS